MHHSMIVLLLLEFHSLMILQKMKSELLMYDIHVLFLLNSHHRLSFVSVVFAFNASLNDVAPMSPMPLAVDG